MSDELTSTLRPGRGTLPAERRARRWPFGVGRLPVGVRWALALTGALVALALAVTAVDLVAFSGRVHPGVTVGDMSVGGMTRAAARDAIAERVAERLALPVTVRANGMTWDLRAEDVALSLDATAHAEAAYAVGRGEFGTALRERLRAVFGGVKVPFEPSCDEQALSTVLDTVSDSVATVPTDAGVVVEGTSVRMTEPADGRDIDRRVARQGLLEAFLSSNREVALGLVTVKPAIGTAEAQEAYEDALAMVSGPLTLYWEDREWQVPAETIGGWIGFRPTGSGDDVRLEAYLVSSEVSQTVLPMVAAVGRPAKNATFKVSNQTVSIVPAVDGLAADTEELATRLVPILTGTGERRAELTMRRVEPEVTTEEARAMGIKERISTFTTTYSASNKPRNNNIHVLARTLNGVLIAPGEVFDLNATAGPSTREKGYLPAGAIVNGRLETELGGGICQVATTLFNTVFFSGLPVVERHPHSLYISHYPKGRDAAISIGGKNLRFRNDTPNWILIATSYTDTSITISLYGTDPGYTVTYETGPWTNLVPPPVREIKDATLPQGTRVIVERGVSGRSVVVTRTVSKGGAVVRTDTFRSTYRPSEEVVRVGTKPVASTPTTTTP